MKRRHGNNDAIAELCHKSIKDEKQVQNMIMQICDDINRAYGYYDIKQWRKYKPRSWQLCNSWQICNFASIVACGNYAVIQWVNYKPPDR